MLTLAFVFAVSGLLLAAIALSAGKVALDNHGRRLARLEELLDGAERGNRHDRLARDHRDIGEADLFGYVRLRDELLENARIADWYAKRAAHVAAGGRPDDDPRQWRSYGENVDAADSAEKADGADRREEADHRERPGPAAGHGGERRPANRLDRRRGQSERAD